MSTISSTDDVFASLGLSREHQQKAPHDATELGLETFLQLMVTQLNNQDPFEPMDNGAFLGQIAQFGTVSGLDKLNDAFGGLAANLTSDQALQAGALVGRNVLAPLETGYLAPDASIKGRVELASAASGVTVRITDQAGQLIRELPLGPHVAGNLEFSWDGMTHDGRYAAPGLYAIGVQAEHSSGTLELQPQLYAAVDSVSVNRGGGLTLNLAGLGAVPFDKITEIR